MKWQFKVDQEAELMEMMAILKEFGRNYASSSIPIGKMSIAYLLETVQIYHFLIAEVRQSYTYVTKTGNLNVKLNY